MAEFVLDGGVAAGGEDGLEDDHRGAEEKPLAAVLDEGPAAAVRDPVCSGAVGRVLPVCEAQHPAALKLWPRDRDEERTWDGRGGGVGSLCCGMR